MKACSLALLWVTCSLAWAFGESLPSPLRAVERAGPELGTPLAFDHAAYRSAKQAGSRLVLREFPLDGARKVNLEVERFDVYSSHTRIVVVRPDGEYRLPLPDVLLYRGKIQGEEDSEVYLGLSPHLSNGWVFRGSERYILSTRDSSTTITEVSSFITPTPGPWRCEALLPPGPMGGSVGEVPALSYGRRTAAIALETDREFTQVLFGNNPNRAATYVAQLYGAMTFIFERDLQTRLAVTYLRLWMTEDPWDRTNTGDQLIQYRNYWVNHMTHVPRALGHFLSARGLGGGVAWVSVVCNPWWGFALSANLAGYFNPTLEPHWSNWDPFVVAHEMGHNFGSLHTHDGYDPPIDTCGLGCNNPPFTGTIMSYCHICPGGMWNIQLRFHERCIDRILQYLLYESGCDLTRAWITGTVNLEHFRGNYDGFGGILELRDPGTMNVRHWDIPFLNAQRRFRSSWRVECGDYDALLYWDTFLGKLFDSIIVAAPAIDLETTLRAGDANFDNIVNVLDISYILPRFSRATWQGDVNWDGLVDLADLSIVLMNYGKVGDN